MAICIITDPGLITAKGFLASHHRIFNGVVLCPVLSDLEFSHSQKKSLNAKIQQKPAKQTLRKAQDGEGKQKYGSAAGADVNVKVGRSNQTHAVYIPCMYDY